MDMPLPISVSTITTGRVGSRDRDSIDRLLAVYRPEFIDGARILVHEKSSTFGTSDVLPTRAYYNLLSIPDYEAHSEQNADMCLRVTEYDCRMTWRPATLNSFSPPMT